MTRLQRIAAAALGLSAAFAGFWAALAPGSFFASFPLPGHHWVAPLPPYNEHLTRDVGELYLALLVVTAWAVARPSREATLVTGLAWLVFGLPHLIFHLDHLTGFATGDATGSLVALGGTVVLAAVLLAPARGKERA